MDPTEGGSTEGGGREPDVRLSQAARADLEAQLGHVFASPELLVRALTHSSRAHEEGDPTGGNERLEFLGDAVLDVVISELLMELRPSAREGVLSRARAAAVNQGALASQAEALGLSGHVRLGRGEERSDGRHKPRILANVFEAVLGALYLDGGLAPVRALVERSMGSGLVERVEGIDAKSRLQELLQRRGEAVPEYVHTRVEGPDHAPEFRAEVHSGGHALGQGSGRSKREAEQAAAGAALGQLEP